MQEIFVFGVLFVLVPIQTRHYVPCSFFLSEFCSTPKNFSRNQSAWFKFFFFFFDYLFLSIEEVVYFIDQRSRLQNSQITDLWMHLSWHVSQQQPKTPHSLVRQGPCRERPASYLTYWKHTKANWQNDPRTQAVESGKDQPTRKLLG